MAKKSIEVKSQKVTVWFTHYRCTTCPTETIMSHGRIKPEKADYPTSNEWSGWITWPPDKVQCATCQTNSNPVYNRKAACSQ